MHHSQTFNPQLLLKTVEVCVFLMQNTYQCISALLQLYCEVTKKIHRLRATRDIMRFLIGSTVNGVDKASSETRVRRGSDLF